MIDTLKTSQGERWFFASFFARMIHTYIPMYVFSLYSSRLCIQNYVSIQILRAWLLWLGIQLFYLHAHVYTYKLTAHYYDFMKSKYFITKFMKLKYFDYIK
jgi:hypothetical protein